MAGWWYRATREQKLAQIDAGIELGMTSEQVAMNCGCVREQQFSKGNEGATVRAFANHHGRNFPQVSDTSIRKSKKNGGTTFRSGRRIGRVAARIEDAKDAYFSGEPIDIWAVE